MSHRSGPSSPRASASSGTRAPRKVSNFERQAHYHRLSKVPDRYTAKLSAAPEDPSDLTPFATNFYREHPDEEDLSTPEEKLEQLNSVLDSDPSSAERFTALSQKKAMIYLINGDESKEMIDVLRDLGHFYSENKRDESALRNFKAASNLRERVEVTREESLEISLDLAEAHMNMQNRRKANVKAAKSAIAEFEKDKPKDSAIRRRLELVRARIARAEERWEDADEKYKAVIDGNSDPAVFVESGDVCQNVNDNDRAKSLYTKAIKIYKRDGNDAMAAEIQEKLDLLGNGK